MHLFDTHCHINFKAFQADAPAVLERARRANIQCLIVGTDLPTCQRAIELSDDKDIFAAVGFHPIHIKDRQLSQVKEILNLAKSPKVKAIGEIGFDTFYLKKENEIEGLEIQEQILDQFLEIAIKLQKPVIFHCRGPLEKLRQKIEAFLPELKKIGACVHCYAGDQALADFLVKNGFFLGFNGLITKNHAWDQIIKNIPIENILLETDAPFLTPVGVIDKRNEPVNVKLVARRISQLKNNSISQIVRTTSQNARQFLGLNN